MKLVVKVHPSSKFTRITHMAEDSPYDIEVYLREPREGNKANRELVRLLRDEFNAKEVKIVKGLKSKIKVVVLD